MRAPALRSVEEGYSEEVVQARRRRYSRVKRARHVLRSTVHSAALALLLAASWRFTGSGVDKHMQALVRADGCGGLEYFHPSLRRVPLLYISDASAVWFPRYVANASSAKIRSYEQSIVCNTTASRLRHLDVTVHSPFKQHVVRLQGRRATCAAHRIDFMKYGNCSF